MKLDGEDVTGLDPYLLARRGLSRTFQNLQIFQAMTVLENAISGYHLQERGPILADLLNLPSSRRRSQAAAEGARRLLDRVGLGNAAEKEASALSYGALKRLEIARALALAPPRPAPRRAGRRLQRRRDRGDRPPDRRGRRPRASPSCSWSTT